MGKGMCLVISLWVLHCVWLWCVRVWICMTWNWWHVILKTRWIKYFRPVLISLWNRRCINVLQVSSHHGLKIFICWWIHHTTFIVILIPAKDDSRISTIPSQSMPEPQNKENSNKAYLASIWSTGAGSSRTGNSTLLSVVFCGSKPENAPEPKLPKLKLTHSVFVTCKWSGIITAGLSSAIFFATNSSLCRLKLWKFAAAAETLALESSTARKCHDRNIKYISHSYNFTKESKKHLQTTPAILYNIKK